MLKRGRELGPGDVVVWVTRPNRTVAEVRHGVVASKYPPHREYKVVEVRWEGDDDFAWTHGASSWVSVADPGRLHAVSQP